MTCSLFEQSAVGRCFYNKAKEGDADNEVDHVGMKDLLPILKEFNIWQFTVFYTILCFRIKSIQGNNLLRLISIKHQFRLDLPMARLDLCKYRKW